MYLWWAVIILATIGAAAIATGLILLFMSLCFNVNFTLRLGKDNGQTSNAPQRSDSQKGQ